MKIITLEVDVPENMGKILKLYLESDVHPLANRLYIGTITYLKRYPNIHNDVPNINLITNYTKLKEAWEYYYNVRTDPIDYVRNFEFNAIIDKIKSDFDREISCLESSVSISMSSSLLKILDSIYEKRVIEEKNTHDLDYDKNNLRRLIKEIDDLQSDMKELKELYKEIKNNSNMDQKITIKVQKTEFKEWLNYYGRSVDVFMKDGTNSVHVGNFTCPNSEHVENEENEGKYWYDISWMKTQIFDLSKLNHFKNLSIEEISIEEISKALNEYIKPFNNTTISYTYENLPKFYSLKKSIARRKGRISILFNETG